MCKLLLKLDEVNAGCTRKYNAILWDFHVFHSISSIYRMWLCTFSKNKSESKLKILKFLF